MTQAEIIQQARERAGLTQKQLAARIGYGYKQITKWERGERLATDAAITKLAAALDLEPDDLYRAAGTIAPDIIAGLAQRPHTVAELRRHMAHPEEDE